jgi:hypothetical protein
MATLGALKACAATGENAINYIVRHMNLDPGLHHQDVNVLPMLPVYGVTYLAGCSLWMVVSRLVWKREVAHSSGW